MKKITSLLLALCFSTLLMAEVEFRITESNASAIPIAILPFINNSQNIDIAKVVADDLMLSGQFRALEQQQLIENPQFANQIKYATWRALEADYLTIGSVQASAPGRYELYIKLFSVADQKQLLSLTLPVLEGDLRSGGHYIADKIYEEITGIKGIFSTKIAYVTATKLADGIEYQLLVADADGKNSQALVTSQQPLLSPKWSPRGDKLAYVSFEKGNSAIYIQDLSTGGRELMSSYKGINSGPSFSPDGKSLALTLSKSGNPEIYLMDIYTKKLKRITDSWAIDTGANWAPDGESLVFTSDRGGKPNLYQIDLQSLVAKRITFESDYNAGGSLSPNGDYICYVQGDKNNYKIALRHNKSETSQQISNGPLDETPTFAPNNNMILYASKNKKGQGILISTSLDGATKNQLIVSNGHIREPSWSPVIN
ncbi:MAG: Tol-Pal system beta propeller repeat protein TolB [Alcanivoracaceae bacterium]|nr:Tol-Pal system beta propeller repeat protein TolB [Alcanivoracaceae bacterium]